MNKGKRLRKIIDEIWIKIPYADKRYEVSNYGRIKSYCSDKKEGRVIKATLIKGFPAVSFQSEGKKRTFFVHKLTAEMFVPKTAKNQEVVIHLDWKKTNNYYENLKWITKEKSYKRTLDKIRQDRSKDGKVLTYSKLNAEDVLQIKKMLHRGTKQNIIAKLFCVSEMQITRIKRGENWGEIKLSEQDMMVEQQQEKEQENVENKKNISIENTQEEKLQDFSIYSVR